MSLPRPRLPYRPGTQPPKPTIKRPAANYIEQSCQANKMVSTPPTYDPNLEPLEATDLDNVPSPQGARQPTPAQRVQFNDLTIDERRMIMGYIRIEMACQELRSVRDFVQEGDPINMGELAEIIRMAETMERNLHNALCIGDLKVPKKGSISTRGPLPS